MADNTPLPAEEEPRVPMAQYLQDARAIEDTLKAATQEPIKKSFCSYEALREAIQQGPDEVVTLHRVYAAIKQYNTDHLEVNKTYWKNVRKKGYRLMEAREHYAEARKEHRKSIKHIDHGIALLVNTRVGDMTPDERRRQEGLTIALQASRNAHHYTEDRVSKLERTVNALLRRQARPKPKTAPDADAPEGDEEGEER